MNNENFFSSINVKRSIDVVFVLDATGSAQPYLDVLKKGISSFKNSMIIDCNAKGVQVEAFRVKFIAFRDYGFDEERSMVESKFFELPSDEAECQEFIDSIVASGGGDAPENFYEALVYAMRSDWTIGGKDRQIMVMFTDAPPLPLQKRASSKFYPQDMPKNYKGLLEMYQCMGQGQNFKLQNRLKRLLIYAPDIEEYRSLAKDAKYADHVVVEMAEGLKELTFDEVVQSIAKSASAN